MAEFLAMTLVSSLFAVGIIAFLALLTGKDFGSSFVTLSFVALLVAVFSGQWSFVLGILIGVPSVALVAFALRTKR